MKSKTKKSSPRKPMSLERMRAIERIWDIPVAEQQRMAKRKAVRK